MADLQPYMPYIIIGLTGLVAGWLAGLLLGGGGLIRNLVVGVMGAFVGSFLVNAKLLPLPESSMAYVKAVPYGPEVLISTIGAIVVIVLARIIGR